MVGGNENKRGIFLPKDDVSLILLTTTDARGAIAGRLPHPLPPGTSQGNNIPQQPTARPLASGGARDGTRPTPGPFARGRSRPRPPAPPPRPLAGRAASSGGEGAEQPTGTERGEGSNPGMLFVTAASEGTRAEKIVPGCRGVLLPPPQTAGRRRDGERQGGVGVCGVLRAAAAWRRGGAATVGPPPARPPAGPPPAAALRPAAGRAAPPARGPAARKTRPGAAWRTERGAGPGRAAPRSPLRLPSRRREGRAPVAEENEPPPVKSRRVLSRGRSATSEVAAWSGLRPLPRSPSWRGSPLPHRQAFACLQHP